MQLKKKNDTIDENAVRTLQKGLSVSSLLAEILVSRGIDTVEEGRKFIYGKVTDLSSPYLFSDMSRVVDRLQKAFRKSEKIIVYGDYDCDGVGAIAILYLAAKDHGIRLSHYIPTRATEGYGLNRSAIEWIAENERPDLLVTVDCGINSIDEVLYAKEKGMDVIVTDHHQPGEILPDCLILNPCLSDAITPYCGAGVVFSLVRALFGDKDASKYMDICAISTVADIVPLVGDNRLIVKFGLDAIHKGRCRQGIKDLAYAAKADYKTLSTADIGFKLAPRINAAGRLSSAEVSFSLLAGEDPTELRLLSQQLALLNTERQTMNSDIFEEALCKLRSYDFSRHKIIMLKGNWNEGVVGIVCAKLAEYFNLPTILVCSQEGKTSLKGSARSIPGVNLYELFDKNNEYLLTYGGHEMAAGISFEEEFFDRILEQFNDYLSQTIPEDVFEKKTYYDAELAVHDIDQAILSEIGLLEPFGHRNPTPIFLDTSGKPKFSRIGKSSHIKARYKTGDLIAFDKLKYADVMAKNGFSFTYHFDKNYFNGKIYPQFVVNDLIIRSHRFHNNDLLESFCKFFLAGNLPEPSQAGEKRGDTPTLFVSFDAGNVNALMANEPNLNVCVFGQPYCELKNTLVVAPDVEYPFYFYGKIVFLEKIGASLQSALTSGSKPVEIGTKKISACRQSVEELRELFVRLKKECQTPCRFLSAGSMYDDIYPEAMRSDLSKNKFIVGVYILWELGLLTVSDSGILSVVNKKASLTQSELFRYVND